MFLASHTSTASRVNAWVTQVPSAVSKRDGNTLCQLLRTCNMTKSDLTSLDPNQFSKKFTHAEFIIDYLAYLKSRANGPESATLEILTTCLRKLTIAYADESGNWLFPVFVFALTLSRRRAKIMDNNISSKWKKKMAEIYRELFPILHKEKERLPGTCWLICELLSLYMALDQVKLCAPILAALAHSLVRDGGFKPESVPKSLAVTLYYYWAKYHIMESKYADARSKLEWAYVNCDPRHTANRKRIAEYLIPSMIVSGIFPRERLLLECGLDYFVGLAEAIKLGDVGKYNELMELHAPVLAMSGTLLLMEKSKVICYRNLAKRTYLILKEMTGEVSKLDLDGFAAVWESCEGVSRDEMICSLAELIYSGAVKGYVSLEHNKLVLSKLNPFPSVSTIM